jgi:hypothetical protein
MEYAEVNLICILLIAEMSNIEFKIDVYLGQIKINLVMQIRRKYFEHM